MIEVYLFDWGDTLMKDFPGVSGKMCDWKEVEAVEGANEVLRFLSRQAKIYVATGAEESTEEEIKRAFNRVGLDKYISGYFCKANLGVDKGSSDFLAKILEKLEKKPNNVMMVGDSLTKDIEPAQALGINAVWISTEKPLNKGYNIRVVSSLKELCQ